MTTALTISGSFTFTLTGLEVPEGYRFNVQEWLQACLSLRQFVSTVDAAVAFNWGDLLNKGEEELGSEECAQGLDTVLPINADDFQLQRAEKTILQYKRLARETPKWMRGLPGLSARHYLDAIRINDLNQRYDHLVQASVSGWSVRRAAQELPPSPNPRPLPPTRDDLNHLLTVENHHLQHELDAHRALMEEASGNITQARDILNHVVEELPVEQAEQVQRALGYLRPIVEQPGFTEFVDLAGCAIDLWEQGRVSEMGDVMDRLGDLRREIVGGKSARADDNITVNGRVENRREWLEKDIIM